MSRQTDDPQQARYLRKRHAEEGVDEDQQDQEKQFGQNLQQALESYSKKTKNKNIQQQVQYFGHMIEPFNMRQEQDMGDIDNDGYFVFKRKSQYRDAWLDSIEQGNDQMVADKVKKRIKTQGAGIGYRGVYDEGEVKQQNQGQQQNQAGSKKKNKPIKLNRITEQKQVNSDQQQEQQQHQEEQEQQQQQNEQRSQIQQQQEQELSLEPNQIKLLLCQLLPQNKSANSYLKQLKKNIKNKQNKELHDKILEICNLYIQKTKQYDILTSKRQQLEVQAGQGQQQQEQEVNWDQNDEQSDQKVKNVKSNNKISSTSVNNKFHKKDEQKQQHYSDDDIF